MNQNPKIWIRILMKISSTENQTEYVRKEALILSRPHCILSKCISFYLGHQVHDTVLNKNVPIPFV